MQKPYTEGCCAFKFTGQFQFQRRLSPAFADAIRSFIPQCKETRVFGCANHDSSLNLVRQERYANIPEVWTHIIMTLLSTPCDKNAMRTSQECGTIMINGSSFNFTRQERYASIPEVWNHDQQIFLFFEINRKMGSNGNRTQDFYYPIMLVHGYTSEPLVAS